MCQSKWTKKTPQTFVHVGRDELYKKKEIKITMYIHTAAFINDESMMDYIEYRLNLDHGTKGLIILDNIETMEGTNEVSNAA